MEKIDYKKKLNNLYHASAKNPSVFEVPSLNYLMIDGTGNPSGQAFQDAVSALYPAAYILKFAVRERLGIDYAVMPLEVAWQVNRERKGEFAWTAMIMQPPLIDQEMFDWAKREAVLRKNPFRIGDLRLESVEEGLCLQMLHLGPYEAMNDTLGKMLTFTKENGYQSGRDTHDIYLNSIKKTRPENLKTIMRLPIWNKDIECRETVCAVLHDRVHLCHSGHLLSLTRRGDGSGKRQAMKLLLNTRATLLGRNIPSGSFSFAQFMAEWG